jgi:Holliday junction resolvase-like predicted endonuclease
MATISKSSRHSKITGNFGEQLILYWLSKHGFECALVDHTGIDIIARNPHTDEVMGISVKSRSRNPGTEQTYISIPNEQFDKAEAACKAFGCVPYFAIVVDEADIIHCWILSMEHLLDLYPRGERVAGWKMRERSLGAYANDPDIMAFELSTKTTNWW